MLPSHATAAGLPPAGAGPDAGEAEIRVRDGRHLFDYASLFLAWWRLVAAVAVVPALALLAHALLARPEYRATAQILVDRQTPQFPELRDLLYSDVRGDEYYLTQIKLLQSQAVAARAAATLPLASAPEFAALPPAGRVGAFRARVDAERQEQSQFVTVSFEASSPALAAAGANAVSEAYIEEALRIRGEAVAQAAAGLSRQIVEQQQKVDAAQAELRSLGEREHLVSFEDRRDLLAQKMKVLGAQLTERKIQRLEKEALIREVKAAPDPQTIPVVVADRVVQELRIDLARLERREVDLLGRYMENHPEVLKVRAELAEARRGIAAQAARRVAALQAEYATAVAAEEGVARAVDAAQAEALDLSRRGARYEEARRDLESRQALLNMLLSRTKQADVASELRVSPIRIVDRALEPLQPVRPRPLRDTVLGLILGLVLGLLAALVADGVDGRVLTARDVATHLGLPVLAEVPLLEEAGAPRVLREAGQATAFAESFRTLRAALDALPAAPAQVVALVSAAAGEGKTLTAVNLALALAARGDETVLVDGDLRHAHAHDLLAASRSPGVADVLAGRAAGFEAVQALAGTRLRLLAAGNAPANGSDALRPDGVDALLSSLRERYRYVVVDTPPLAVVADALAFAARADAVVVVVGAGVARRRDVLAMLARLRAAGIGAAGVVLNRAATGLRFHHYGIPFRQWRGGAGAGEDAAAAPLARTG